MKPSISSLRNIFLLLFVSVFIQAQPNQAPRLRTPSDHSILQVPGSQLNWDAVSNASIYKLKVAKDSAMSQLVFQDDNVTTTNRIVQNLDFNTLYYWSVQAVNNKGAGPESQPFSLTTMPDNPNAVKGHPRLLITEQDLPVLRQWAVNTNPIFVALQNMLNSAINTYNTKFYPGGIENPNWPDLGNTTWSGYVTEQYAEFFAFWSMIDPNVSERINHARRARRLLMYVIDHALLGPAANIPFRDPGFMTYDRSRVYGEAFGLTVDWIYNIKDENNNNILSTNDKAKIQEVFLRWCTEQLTAYNHPTPVGLLNDQKIDLTNRWILNNYFSGHARNMTFMALSIDAKDDVPIDSSIHYTALGNSLRSFLFNATGAWLYQQYAQYEFPEIVSTDYGVPSQGLGMGSGGLSVEGSLYGESIGWVAQSLLALKTSGWADEKIIGKQIRLLHSDYWTRLLDGLIHSIAPVPYVPKEATYYGEIYPVANYGDLLRTWMTPFMIDVTAPIGLIDMRYGNNQNRLNKARWFTLNALEGGMQKTLYHINNIWASSLATHGLYYFLLIPPGTSNPPDPRPEMEATFWDNSWQKVLARTDWSSESRWFNWQCHWTKINHQAGDGNQFEFYRKGEWLTKERSGYTNDNVGTTSEFHNTLALQNDIPPFMQWYEGPISERGGQWKEGLNAGDPYAIKSFAKDYIYATGVSTNLYNRYNGANDIEHASRSIFWLKPDHILVYDRAQSKTENRFKRFFLQFTAEPIVHGKNLTVNTPGNQKLYLSNLLPTNSVLTPSVSEKLSALAEQEFTTHQIKIEDPTHPKEIRFLNVLQGADATSIQDHAVLIQSHLGTEFEGAAINQTSILFIKHWDATFSETAWSVPNTIKYQFISGVKPHAGFNVKIADNGNQLDINLITGSQIYADDGGVIYIDLSKLNTNIVDPSTDDLVISNLNIIPNPFHDQTSLQYHLKESGMIRLDIFNLYGQKVLTPFSNFYQSKGQHQFDLNAQSLKPGIYTCQLTQGKSSIKEMVVVLK